MTKRTVLQIRLTDDELARARDDAQKNGLTVSGYIRSLITTVTIETPKAPRARKRLPEITSVVRGSDLQVTRCVCGHLQEKHFQGARSCQVGHCQCKEYSEPPE